MLNSNGCAFRRVLVIDIGRNFLTGIIGIRGARELSKRRENPIHFRLMPAPDAAISKELRERLK
jgi:hypothetical protein